MDIKKYSEDDICDIYFNRICDNCGDCLKEQGIDVRAIKIEDIAKTLEENEFLEAEYKRMLESLKEEENSQLENTEEFIIEEGESSEYIDAFDHIEYIDDLECLEDNDFEEITEEVFPGFRRLKSK